MHGAETRAKTGKLPKKFVFFNFKTEILSFSLQPGQQTTPHSSALRRVAEGY